MHARVCLPVCKTDVFFLHVVGFHSQAGKTVEIIRDLLRTNSDNYAVYIKFQRIYSKQFVVNEKKIE